MCLAVLSNADEAGGPILHDITVIRLYNVILHNYIYDYGGILLYYAIITIIYYITLYLLCYCIVFVYYNNCHVTLALLQAGLLV